MSICVSPVKFSAAGEWTYNPHVGFHSAMGHPNYPRATKNYKLQGIWESVGGSPQTDDMVIAERFGDRIGQYANGNWIFYDNVTFNLNVQKLG
jgi:hypothetical protein